jgi:hypothetical protein
MSTEEDLLLLEALRGVPHGRPSARPIRLRHLSSRSQDALDRLIARIEHSMHLLGLATSCVRPEIFGLLGIDVRLASGRELRR